MQRGVGVLEAEVVAARHLGDESPWPAAPHCTARCSCRRASSRRGRARRLVLATHHYEQAPFDALHALHVHLTHAGVAVAAAVVFLHLVVVVVVVVGVGVVVKLARQVLHAV